VAKLIEVMSTIGPKLVYGRTIELDELAEWTANRSGLTAEEVERVLKAVRSAVIHYCRAGGAVRLPGMGRVRPAIDRTGRVRARIVPDPELDKAFNAKGGYRGEVLNRSAVGLTDEQLKALWDEAHPDNPLELPERRAS